MTVTELIERLSALPGDLPVMGSDYEDGNYEITRAEISEAWSVHPEHVLLS